MVSLLRCKKFIIKGRYLILRPLLKEIGVKYNAHLLHCHEFQFHIPQTHEIIISNFQVYYGTRGRIQSDDVRPVREQFRYSLPHHIPDYSGESTLFKSTASLDDVVPLRIS
jgi:hypothetical protein